MPVRPVVAFTGPLTCGKTTAAKVLEREGFTRIRFAGPLKAMLLALGLTREQVDGDLKETPSDLLCGKTPRFAMQRLGTEWGRELIGDDLWLRAFKHQVDTLPADVPVVVDDARFPNEFELIRRMGGKVVYIDRDGCTTGEHASEQFDLEPDYRIYNGELKAFQKNVSKLAYDFRVLCERDAA